MKLRSIVTTAITTIALTVGGLTMCGCTEFVQKFTHRLLRNQLKFDYVDSEKYGSVIEKELNLTEFTKIDVRGMVKIVITQDSTSSLRVRSYQKYLDEYDIEVYRGKLKVKLKGNETSYNKKTPSLVLLVTAPLIDKVETSGGCELEMIGEVDFPCDLKIETNGVAKVDIPSLKVHNFEIETNGVGDFVASELVAKENVDISLNGAATANINVFCDDLEVDANGAVKVTLSGECNHLKCDDNGASNVDFSKLKR